MITLGYKTKFDSVTRAAAAIGIGLVMAFGGNAPALVVKIIAILLVVAGIASTPLAAKLYGKVADKKYIWIAETLFPSLSPVFTL